MKRHTLHVNNFALGYIGIAPWEPVYCFYRVRREQGSAPLRNFRSFFLTIARRYTDN